MGARNSSFFEIVAGLIAQEALEVSIEGIPPPSLK